MIINLHAHRRNLYKGEVPKHVEYIARQGRYFSRRDLVAIFELNFPAGVRSAKEFFDLADHYERSDGIVAKEWTIGLPRGLSHQQYAEIGLALASNVLFRKPGILAIHDSSASDGGRNPHLHLVYTPRMPDLYDRPVQQLFSRYNATTPGHGGWRKEREGTSRESFGVKIQGDRAMIARVINEFLMRYGYVDRVEDRSYKDQGLNIVPGRHLYPRGMRLRFTQGAGNSMSESDRWISPDEEMDE